MTYEKDYTISEELMEEICAQGLDALPELMRIVLNAAMYIERLNREIRRRTRVASLFPNAASCLRLVTAVVMEISEDWQTGKRYIKWESDSQ